MSDPREVMERVFRNMGIIKTEDMVMVDLSTGRLYMAWGKDQTGVFCGIWGTAVSIYGEKKFVMRQIQMMPDQTSAATRVALEVDALGIVELMDDSGLARVLDA